MLRVGIQRVIILVIALADLVNYVNSSFIKSRTWHEELVANRLGGNARVLYPRYKICRSPEEKPEKVKQDKKDYKGKTGGVTWSSLLAIYTADSGSEIYNWDFWKEETSTNKPTRLQQFTAILIFLVAFIAIFMVFIFLVPIVGSLGFKFYSLIWFVLFHPEMRRICRRIFIAKEKVSRKHLQLLLPKHAMQASKQAKKQFHLPFILREYNEEEVPAELMQSDEDTGEGEISSDGFENLLVKKMDGGRISTVEEKRALVQLLVTAEEEEANHRQSVNSEDNDEAAKQGQ